jgi:hypothetical protein
VCSCARAWSPNFSKLRARLRSPWRDDSSLRQDSNLQPSVNSQFPALFSIALDYAILLIFLALCGPGGARGGSRLPSITPVYDLDYPQKSPHHFPRKNLEKSWRKIQLPGIALSPVAWHSCWLGKDIESSCGYQRRAGAAPSTWSITPLTDLPVPGKERHRQHPSP